MIATTNYQMYDSSVNQYAAYELFQLNNEKMHVDANNSDYSSSWSPFSDADKEEQFVEDIKMDAVNESISIATDDSPSENSFMYSSMFGELELHEETAMEESNGFLKFKDADEILKQREILLNQMSAVHKRYNMSLRTWFLAVNLMDRIFRKCSISDFNSVLLGSTLVYIASKYFEEDSSNSKPDRLMQEADHFKLGFNLEQHIRRLELDILNALNFELTVPTSFSMADVYLKYNFEKNKKYQQIKNKKAFEEQVQELLYKTSFLPSFLTMKPSLIARSCIQAVMIKNSN